VSISDDGSTVTVGIAQLGPWTGSDAQIHSLQEKIHNYVGFIVDGQMTHLYPEAAGLSWQIGLDCHYGAPDPRTQFVLDQVAEAVRKYGGSLVVRTLNP
jgi:hypothetical protein